MRKPRNLQKGAKYHVSNKINTGRTALESDDFKKLFLEILKRAKKKFKFSIYNFVVMSNHYHFIIEPIGNESLSKIMQWIQSVFAKYYNKITKADGHVWRSRFWSKIIKDINQFFDTFNYISENPVKANIIKFSEDYIFGGLYFILKKIFDIVDDKIFI